MASRNLLAIGMLSFFSAASVQLAQAEMRFIQVEATTKQQRTAIESSGMSIESVRSDSVWGFAEDKARDKLAAQGFKIVGNFKAEVGRGGHQGDGMSPLDFPSEDKRFHNYKELTKRLQDLRNKHADIASVISIGKTVEDRDIWAFHINSSGEAHQTGQSGKPGAVFMGNHHAREHVSLEIPLMLIEHLLANRDDAKIAALLDTRDIWIIPMVNPDGAEFDIATGHYKVWRKNRKDNRDGTFGVDLNRNYGYGWGTGGSDKDTSSDVYMGEQPFSEPETQAIRDFVDAHVNTRVLLTFHTYSELILYPWGNKYDSIEEKRDLAVFEKMAKTMAGWNRYKPQQASDLYIASGDTTDWAYGTHKIFAFTFELSPKKGGMGGDGFYPGADIIDRVFKANLNPCLYMIDTADNPYKVLDSGPRGFLKNYVEPAISYSSFWGITPDLSTIGAPIGVKK